jgi:hypothetical protein
MALGWAATLRITNSTLALRHFRCDHQRANEKLALRRNPTGWLIDGAFRYTLQFEEQRLDEDFGMAGLPGVSERDP